MTAAPLTPLNRLRKAWRDKRPTFGAIATIPSIQTVQIMPDRADGVDHVLGREPIAFGDLGVAGLAAVQGPALGEQLGARGAMDRAIDAAASEQR